MLRCVRDNRTKTKQRCVQALLILNILKSNTFKEKHSDKGVKYLRENTMTLLEQTYRQLHEAGLVQSTAGFSRHYLGRNKNWYAWQKYVGRDMGAAATVQCLRTIRSQLQEQTISNTQRAALETAAAVLLGHLRDVHMVADVCS